MVEIQAEICMPGKEHPSIGSRPKARKTAQEGIQEAWGAHDRWYDGD